ncbi:MAG: 23S rRNA (adenine(2503)-C(2))-methyltransferase RlmN [Bacteroidales bacterium]|nr:23S rRNA (adenine(2503)-C(2))-methyltransferase RlmN [Bacteroidales bacterium]
MKEKLLGKTLKELEEIALEAGLKKYAGGQLAKWLYQKKVRSFDAMTDIPQSGRQALGERWCIGVSDPVEMFESSDGTRKYLFGVNCAGKESAVEAVMIPDADRRTLCVSSQAGCRMGCKFCMTGRQGFHGNLDAADILNQFLSVEESDDLTNAVFMGMGEPLDNYEELSRVLTVLCADWGFAWSPKRVTVSTIGVIPTLRRFLEEHSCHLAVSLHNPFPAERESLMPVQKAWSITEVVRLLRDYDFSGQRRLSFEYTMFAGFNDDIAHADALLRLLRGLDCRVNLIRFHKIPDFPLGTSLQSRMEAFRDHLSNHGVTCTIRASRGEDIAAACGLLAGRHASPGQEPQNPDRVSQEKSVLQHFEAQCARREYCSSDVFQKAVRRLEGDREAARRIVDSLQKDGYIDDARYAAAFARDKARLTGWGPIKIRYALRAKGVSQEAIEAALGEASGQEAKARLAKLLAAKKKSLGGDPQARLKLLRYGLSRGYSYEEVEEAILFS